MNKQSTLLLASFLLCLVALTAARLHIAGTLNKKDGSNLEVCRQKLGCSIKHMYDAIFDSPKFTKRSRCMLACLLVFMAMDNPNPESAAFRRAKRAVEVNSCVNYGITL